MEGGSAVVVVGVAPGSSGICCLTIILDFQCIRVCAQSLSHVLLCSPVALQAPLPRQEYWTGVTFLTPGNLPDPRSELVSPTTLALAGGFFTTSTTWEAPAKVLLLLLLSHFSHVRLCVTP